MEFALVGTLEKRPIEPIADVRNAYTRIPIKGKRPKPRRR